jgi:uncharacterized protein
MAGMLRSLPTDDQLRALHERFAPDPDVLTWVFDHSVIVRAVAEHLADRSEEPVDRDLLRVGSLLHDIGVYRLYGEDGVRGPDHYLRHGVLGHEMLAGLGFDESVCRFCSCHVGAGLTRQEVLDRRLPVPPADYLARTTEEALVMYADSFHSKGDPSRFVTADTYAAGLRRFGPLQRERFAALRERFGDPDPAVIARGLRSGWVAEPAVSPGREYGMGRAGSG